MRYMSVAFCLAAVAATEACDPVSTRSGRDRGQVTIVFKCDYDDENADVRIVPWRVKQQPGGTIRWKLSKSRVAKVDITPKTGTWPFGGNPVITVTKDAPGVAAVPETTPDGVYRYNATGTCTNPSNGSSYTIVVDPDMIIRR